MRIALFFTLFMCCISFLCPSCEFSEVDLGYPHKIYFPKEGGELIITGEKTYGHAQIQDYKGNHGSIEYGEDSIRYIVYDWLKIQEIKEPEAHYGYNIRICAAPNPTNRKRKLYIELYRGPEYQVVKVTQE